MTPTNLPDMLDPNVEDDLTNAGFQAARADFTITGVEQKPTKKGDGTVRVVSFRSTGPVNGISALEVKENFNIQNPNADAVRISLGQLKALYTAAFGRPTGAFNRLQGRTVSAEVWEDKEGFWRIGRYRAPGGNAGTSAPTAAPVQAL